MNAAHTPSHSASPAASTVREQSVKTVKELLLSVADGLTVPHHVVGLALVDLGLQGLHLELGLLQLADTLTSGTLILVQLTLLLFNEALQRTNNVLRFKVTITKTFIFICSVS